MRRHLKTYFIPHEDNNYKPHSVRSTSLLALLAIAAIATIATIVSTGNITHDQNLADVHAAFLTRLTSEERVERNLQALNIDPLLVQAAELKAQDMIDNQYFAHVSPRGIEPWDWLRQVGYNYEYAGENLAIDFYDTRRVNQAWLDSPTHRANILNSNYTDIGIAVRVGEYEGRDVAFVVQMFGSKRQLPAPVIPQVVAAVPETNTEPESEPEEQVLGQETVLASETSSVTTIAQLPAEEPIPVTDMSDEIAEVEVLVAEAEETFRTTHAGSIGKFIILIIAVLIALSLLLKTFIEMKRQHYRNMIMAGTALIIVVMLYVVLVLFTGQVTII